MTKNQLAYQSLQETKRSNLAQEAEKARSNRASEQQKRDELNESRRSNVARETLSKQDLQIKEKAQKSRSFKDYISGTTELLESPTRGFKNVASGIDIFS